MSSCKKVLEIKEMLLFLYLVIILNKIYFVNKSLTKNSYNIISMSWRLYLRLYNTFKFLTVPPTLPTWKNATWNFGGESIYPRLERKCYSALLSNAAGSARDRGTDSWQHKFGQVRPETRLTQLGKRQSGRQRSRNFELVWKSLEKWKSMLQGPLLRRH